MPILRHILYWLFLSVSLLAGTTFAMPPAASNAEILEGTVVETMNSSGYTYLLVANGGLQQWVAIPETKVAKGERVAYQQGMTMNDFHSKTLGKTFASIVFSAGLAEKAKTETPSPAPAKSENDSFAAALAAEQQSAPTMPVASASSGGSSGAVVPMEEVSVAKAEGDNGYRVGEIFDRAKDLQGSRVRVRGKVVKVSTAIMGRNWIHLQDGSGDPLKNSHDLVVTGELAPEVGTIVLIEGLLAADKDFGAGYNYSAIVEQAAIVKP